MYINSRIVAAGVTSIRIDCLVFHPVSHGTFSRGERIIKTGSSSIQKKFGRGDNG